MAIISNYRETNQKSLTICRPFGRKNLSQTSSSQKMFLWNRSCLLYPSIAYIKDPMAPPSGNLHPKFKVDIFSPTFAPFLTPKIPTFFCTSQQLIQHTHYDTMNFLQYNPSIPNFTMVSCHGFIPQSNRSTAQNDSSPSWKLKRMRSSIESWKKLEVSGRLRHEFSERHLKIYSLPGGSPFCCVSNRGLLTYL